MREGFVQDSVEEIDGNLFAFFLTEYELKRHIVHRIESFRFIHCDHLYLSFGNTNKFICANRTRCFLLL